MFEHYVIMGIGHIGALVSEWVGPQGVHLPSGIDHILFLLALVLGARGNLQVLKAVTGFTVGHSISLALASFGTVHLPSRWIEAAIALTIVFVAAEDLLKHEFKHRWQLAALFGLIHGFGFAAALQELHLEHRDILVALVGFNLGVEIGQLMLLAVLTPLVVAARREPMLRKYALSTCSVFVFAAGTYWFIARSFG